MLKIQNLQFNLHKQQITSYISLDNGGDDDGIIKQRRENIVKLAIRQNLIRCTDYCNFGSIFGQNR